MSEVIAQLDDWWHVNRSPWREVRSGESQDKSPSRKYQDWPGSAQNQTEPVQILGLSAEGPSWIKTVDQYRLVARRSSKSLKGCLLTGRKIGVSSKSPAWSLPDTRDSVEELFQKLSREWREATRFTSSLTEMCTHPAYQRIIGLGRPVLRLLLEELRTQPDHWFWALQAITGEDPVPDREKGDLPKMAQRWLEWGRKTLSL
jgi:hypothetical protein